MNGQFDRRQHCRKLVVCMLLVLLSMLVATTALAETAVFSDIIDNTFYNNWTISGGNSSYKWVKGSTPGTSDYYAMCRCNHIESVLTQKNAVYVSDVVTLKFDVEFTGVNLDNYLKADVFDGSSWVEVYSLEQRLDAFTTQEIDVSQYANANFKVRFRAICFPSASVHVDNIIITVAEGQPSPSAFKLISPAGGAMDVPSATPTLSWENSIGATSYDLYYGEGTTLPVDATVTGLTAASYTLPRALANETTYTWKVVAKNSGPATRTAGPQSFTTMAASVIPADEYDVSAIYYYDEWGRTIKRETEIGANTYVTETAYDEQSRITVNTYADGSKVYYTYNLNDGSLAALGSQAGGEEYLKSNHYNQYGLLTQQIVGNNITMNYTYDPDNFRKTGVTAVNGSGQMVQNLSYSYGAAGMVTHIVDAKNDTNWSYVYDDLYRLTSAKRDSGLIPGSGNIYNKSYQYNNIDNITNFEGTSYIYNDAAHKHAVTTVTSAEGDVLKTFSYDENGNMTNGDGRTYVWNTENKPTSISRDGMVTTFDYDGNGNRIRKVSGDRETIYVGDCEIDQDGKKTVYISAGRVTVKKVDDGTLFYILKDHLGGTSAILDESGEVVTQQFYQPYGLDDTEGSFENEPEGRKFTGQEKDPETGLYNYNARLYDPALGRFISADPVQGLNRYAYCLNNSINNIDPSGYQTIQDLYPDLPQGNIPIQVSVVDNTIYINAYVKFYGDTDVLICGGDTYAEFAKESIEKGWTTDFVGNRYDFDGVSGNVITNLITEWDDPDQEYLRIMLNAYASEKGGITYWNGWSPEKPGSIKISCDGAITDVLEIDMFRHIFAHEFGHALGLGDAYFLYFLNYRDNIEVGSFDNMWLANKFTKKVSANELEMMLYAQTTGQLQHFVDCLGYNKSPVIKKEQVFNGGLDCNLLAQFLVGDSTNANSWMGIYGNFQSVLQPLGNGRSNDIFFIGSGRNDNVISIGNGKSSQTPLRLGKY